MLLTNLKNYAIITVRNYSIYERADNMDEEKVYINPDGWYPQCNKCGYFDLEYLQEYCPKCGCKQDWSDILRLEEEK